MEYSSIIRTFKETFNNVNYIPREVKTYMLTKEEIDQKFKNIKPYRKVKIV